MTRHAEPFTQLPQECSGAEGVEPIDRTSLDDVATLLEVRVVELQAALCSHTLDVRGERMAIHHSVEQAERLRDALATTLYCNLFGYLTSAVNSSMEAPTNGTNDPAPDEDAHLVGILDLFGFECFDSNSLEQACIGRLSEG